MMPTGPPIVLGNFRSGFISPPEEKKEIFPEGERKWVKKLPNYMGGCSTKERLQWI
jgi:hypothetical protein